MIPSLSDRGTYKALTQGRYLNQASLGLINVPTMTAMHTFLDNVAQYGNMNLSDAEEVGLFTPLRDCASTLMNCSAEQLAIVGSAGEMLSQLPYLFRPTIGSKVIAVASDFPGITRPWIAYGENHDIDVCFVTESSDQDLTQTLIDAIDEKTVAVLVSHVQFSTGSVINCQRLREATRIVGAYLVLDVTQSAGAIPIYADRWQPDVMVCSGYKWLGGHGGVGLGVIDPQLLARTPPAPGWMGADDPFDMQATRLPLAPGARRYTQSTMSYVSIMGLNTSIRQILEIEPEKIKAHADSLANILAIQLEESGWKPFRPIGNEAASSHILSLFHSNSNADTTMKGLLDAGIICSVRNGRVRISFAHYNDETDVIHLVNTLKRIVPE